MRAVYDNPATMRRELWQDGKRIGHLSAEAIAQHLYWPAEFNPGQWSPGKLIGDKEALNANPDHQ